MDIVTKWMNLTGEGWSWDLWFSSKAAKVEGFQFPRAWVDALHKKEAIEPLVDLTDDHSILDKYRLVSAELPEEKALAASLP